MKATWYDIERCLNADTLEEQSLDTLRAFSRVEPLPSSNERYHFRYQQAMQRIRHRIAELEKKVDPKTEDPWWKKPVGIVALAITGGTTVFVIGSLLKFWYPDIFH